MKKYIAFPCESKMNEILETLVKNGINAEANVSVCIVTAFLPAKELIKKSYSLGVARKDYEKAIMLMKD